MGVRRSDAKLIKRAGQFGDLVLPCRISCPEAVMHAPTAADFRRCLAGGTNFHALLIENGFGHIRDFVIPEHQYIGYDPCAKAAFIAPGERSRGNRPHGSEWWLRTCAELRRLGYALVHMGDRTEPELRAFYAAQEFDHDCVFSLEAMDRCIGMSSVMVGASTGPSVYCMLSAIPQILSDSRDYPMRMWWYVNWLPHLAKRFALMPDHALEGALGIVGA